MDESYIKFNCNWIKAEPVNESQISALNIWRDKLYILGLIGADNNGIGFGNISTRFKNQEFLITGSATGGLKNLNECHYVLVNEYDLLQNRLTCTGPIKASSESLSHAAIYECSPETNAVIHVHSMAMWENLMHNVPTTSYNTKYGTPGMAYEIKRLFNKTTVTVEKILVMGGHKGGIISFGATLEEAGIILLEKLQ
jgi:L-ribulose-5-phosphate 4-epimerase